MKRIKFSRDVLYESEGRGKGPSYSEGSTHDFEDHFADRWLRRGAASEVNTREPLPADPEPEPEAPAAPTPVPEAAPDPLTTEDLAPPPPAAEPEPEAAPKAALRPAKEAKPSSGRKARK